MTVIVIVVLITQNAFVGPANSVTAFIIVDCTEEPLLTASNLMTMLVIVIGICPEQAGAAVSDLVTMLVIMIRAIRQDARATEDLLHKFRLLSKQRRGRKTGPAPYIKACPRFCYYRCGLFLPQKDEVQSYTDQDARKHSPGKLSKQYQKSRDAGENQDNSKYSQYLAAINALIHIEHCYTSSSVRV